MPSKRAIGPKAKPPKPPTHPVIRVESWDGFLKLITDSPYSNWAFRGHARAEWPMFSSLSRYLRTFRVDPRAWAEQESRILRIFQRKAHQHLPRVPDAGDDLQWLALMQHHGAPTRLLDFTWSPYVAAFFALERASHDAAVWAVNPTRLNPAARIRLPGGRRILPAEMSPEIPGNFGRYFLEGENPFVWLGEPQTMNRRLIAQSGTFAVPGVLGEPMESILAGYPDPQRTVVQFVLATDRLRDTAMRELYRMNITPATLFPDLDGLARSMAYELEYHWAYDPRTMRRNPGFE